MQWLIRWLMRTPRVETQCRYWYRVESDAGSIEYGCQTAEEIFQFIDAQQELKFGLERSDLSG